MATTLWGIHTKDDHLFLNSNVIAIGWKEFGDLICPPDKSGNFLVFGAEIARNTVK